MAENGAGSALGFTFLGLWVFIANYSPFFEIAFMLALLIMALAWLAGGLFGMGASRMGNPAWVMLCQLFSLCFVVVWLYPASGGKVLFWIMMAGLPTFIVGYFAHGLALHFAVPDWVLPRAAIAIFINAVLTMAFLSGSVVAPVFWAIGGTVVFLFGWIIGAPVTGWRHDAHMGSEEEFERAGYSRDR